ncbi:M56 family metallopeptidase [Sphingobacterium sp. UT-1RO-CII-1]|uniref:M56 family metallopeptidase n=1 Tax=Sphingobacterium sp. UT-1RO-CII-1 TaxID=2995225 RepID=UPI00227D0EAC|nr:M56 family metallopeptidase [Sphingobacterium sp. UT-1RO-CII-1]MCY4778136.1 M56 family metallopeptidase [Sphingobacterium sp. UT-1RO-CII-1]
MMYLILVNLSLILFFGVYYIVFRRLTFFHWNRIFLIGAGLLSIFLPLLQYLELSPHNTVIQSEGIREIIQLAPIHLSIHEGEGGTKLSWLNILLLIYLIGVIGSLCNLALRYLKVRKMLNGQLQSSQSFSFFNRVVVAKGGIGENVIRQHEEVHVMQGHSYDIILLEFVRVFCWFNPICHYYLEEMKFQHECLADKVCATDKIQYAELLVANVMNIKPELLVHEFSNDSILKRRIQMLFKKPTKGNKYLYYLLAVPVVVLVIVGTLFSNASIAKTVQNNSLVSINQRADSNLAYTPNQQQKEARIVFKQPADTTKQKNKDEDLLFNSVEIPPEPIGGISEFRVWVSNNYKYPQEAIDAGVKGQIIIGFIVDKEGVLSDFKVVKDLGHGTGEALIDALKKAKPWRAGIQNGRKVRVEYQLPMTLNLEP